MASRCYLRILNLNYIMAPGFKNHLMNPSYLVTHFMSHYDDICIKTCHHNYYR